MQFYFPGQPPNQARRVPATAAHCLHFAIIIIDDSGNRQVGTIALGFFQTDAEILAHPVNRKTKLKLVVKHRVTAIFHLPGTGGTLGDDIDNLVTVKPGALRKIESFGQPLHQPGYTDLVDHLGQADPHPHRRAVRLPARSS